MGWKLFHFSLTQGNKAFLKDSVPQERAVNKLLCLKYFIGRVKS